MVEKTGSRNSGLDSSSPLKCEVLETRDTAVDIREVSRKLARQVLCFYIESLMS